MVFFFLDEHLFPNDFALMATFRIRENNTANLITLYDSTKKEIMAIQIGYDLDLFYSNGTHMITYKLSNRTRINDGL
jgi:hypothetical protein